MSAAASFATDEALRDKAWAIAAQIADPEIPVLTIADLGILRSVTVADGRVEIAITPTYSGCPAMPMIARDIENALVAEGVVGALVRLVLAPAWTTQWMSEEGRRKLSAYGIAPPTQTRCGTGLFAEEKIACPRCGSRETELLSAFGSTSCKALWRCRSCREPFDYFKCH